RCGRALHTGCGSGRRRISARPENSRKHLVERQCVPPITLCPSDFLSTRRSSSSALLVVCGLCESEPPVRGVKAGAAGTPRFMNRVRFAVGECVLPAPRAQEVWTTRVFLLRRRNFCVTHAWEGTVSVPTPHPPRPPHPPPAAPPGAPDGLRPPRPPDPPHGAAPRAPAPPPAR